MAEKLPEEFKIPLERELQRCFEYQFHSADYHTLLRVVTGLKTVVGHLVKVNSSDGGSYM